MGLDLTCGKISMRYGSYSSIPKIHYHLLAGIKFYIEMVFPEEEKKINYLTSLLKEKNTLQYKNLNFRDMVELGDLCLDGFNSFILHDFQGTMSSGEAELFLETWDIVEDYIDSSIKNEERKFFLYDVFKESKKTQRPIIFS